MTSIKAKSSAQNTAASLKTATSPGIRPCRPYAGPIVIPTSGATTRCIDLDEGGVLLITIDGDEETRSYWRGDDPHRHLAPAFISRNIREWWVGGREISWSVRKWITDNGYPSDPEQWTDVIKWHWMMRFAG